PQAGGSVRGAGARGRSRAANTRVRHEHDPESRRDAAKASRGARAPRAIHDTDAESAAYRERRPGRARVPPRRSGGARRRSLRQGSKRERVLIVHPQPKHPTTPTSKNNDGTAVPDDSSNSIQP